MTIGIYKLYNTETNNIYIGQSRNIEKREIGHKTDLILNKHHNKNIQYEFNAICKRLKDKTKDNPFYNYIDFKSFVADNFYKVEIIETFEEYDEINIKEMEDKYILKYRDESNKYNQHTNKELEEYIIKREEKKVIESEKARLYWINKNICECNNKSFKITIGNEELEIIHTSPLNIEGYILNYLISKDILNNENVVLTLRDLSNYTPYNGLRIEDYKKAISELRRYNIINIDLLSKKNLSTTNSKDKIQIEFKYDNLIDNIILMLNSFNYNKYQYSHKIIE